MLIFYMLSFLVKSSLIYVVYQDMSSRFDLPMMNFWQVLMTITFLVMIKIVVLSNDYADIEAFKKMPTGERIMQEMVSVFVIFMLMCFYYVYSSFL